MAFYCDLNVGCVHEISMILEYIIFLTKESRLMRSMLFVVLSTFEEVDPF
jgi:hypothetical protein